MNFKDRCFSLCCHCFVQDVTNNGKIVDYILRHHLVVSEMYQFGVCDFEMSMLYRVWKSVFGRAAVYLPKLNQPKDANGWFLPQCTFEFSDLWKMNAIKSGISSAFVRVVVSFVNLVIFRLSRVVFIGKKLFSCFLLYSNQTLYHLPSV